MGKGLIKGTIFGGVIVFVWMMISWMFIPWHCPSLNAFKDGDAVATTLMQNTEASGIYVYPNFCQEKDQAKLKAAFAKGPFIFTAITREGKPMNTPRPYIASIITQLVGAFLITWLLLQAKDLSYAGRVGFVTVIGLVIGILSGLPTWNWWGFPINFVIVSILDLVIGWFLASLAIAAVAKR